MPGYLCVYLHIGKKMSKKKHIWKCNFSFFFFANNTLLREVGVRHEGMSQSIIFLILANLTWFFNGLNIPLWNVSQLQRCVLTLSTSSAPSVACRCQTRWQLLVNFCFFWRTSAADDSRNIIRSEQAVVNLSMEAPFWLKSPRTTQLFKIERRDGIVVTGTIPLKQIYTFISDDIRRHIHTKISE